MAKVILREGGVAREFVILGEVSVGRLPENTIRLDDALVSRKHAKITVQGQEYVLEDLGSAGGTLVNGQKATRHALRDGDQIQIGAARLAFVGDSLGAAGAMFEKTMVGADPFNERTLIGNLPPAGAPAPAGGSPAAPPPVGAAPPPVPPSSPRPVAFKPTPTAAGARPRIIMPRKSIFASLNRRKVIQVAAALLIFGGGGGWLLVVLLTPHETEADWAPVEALYKEGRLTELQAQLQVMKEAGLGPKDQVKWNGWKTKLDGESDARQVETLIYEKKDFLEAYGRAQAAVNKYSGMPELAGRFTELSKLALSANYIQESPGKTENAETGTDMPALTNALERCREATARYKESEATMARLPKVAEAYRICAARQGKLQERLQQCREAERAWKEVETARGLSEWTREVAALRQLVKLPGEVSARLVGKTPLAKQLENAEHYTEGVAAYEKADYDTAMAALTALQADEVHGALAAQLVEKMRQAADYNRGLKLYREGKGDEALAVLRNAQAPNAVELRARIEKVMTGRKKLLDFQAKDALDELMAAAVPFLATLDPQADHYYHDEIAALIKSSRGKWLEIRYAELDQLFQKKKYGDAYRKSGELLAQCEKAAYPELHQKITTLRENTLRIILKDVGQYLKAAQELWGQYSKDPITSDERTATSGVLPGYRRKAGLLKDGFDQISQVQGVVQALPENQAKPVLDLYEAVRQEIVRQAEKVFGVRTQYAQLGNFQLTRQADEMILMLGDTPGNQYYRMVVEKKE